MVKMPTGDEAPVGFEKLYAAREAIPEQGEITVNCVTVSQLAESEMAEIQHLRMRAEDFFLEMTGVEPTRETFEDWLSFSPRGLTRSDQLIFRAYSGRYLTGYAHVFCGLFGSGEWTIMTVVVDPSFRLQGIGSKMIAKAESYAQHASVHAINYAAIPTHESEGSLWGSAGYTTEISRFEWTVGLIPREVIIYRKEFDH